MILTDKAKEDFETWYLKMLREKPDILNRYFDEHLLSFFWNSDDTIRNARITEWFRKIEFHISVYPHGDGLNWCFGITHFKNDPKHSIFNRLSYKIYKENEKLKVDDYDKCMILAIKKANEIYNS